MKTINYGTRARLGMLLPSSNQAAEPQFQAMLPPGVSVHTTRLKLTGNSKQDLLGMTERIENSRSGTGQRARVAGRPRQPRRRSSPHCTCFAPAAS